MSPTLDTPTPKKEALRCEAAHDGVRYPTVYLKFNEKRVDRSGKANLANLALKYNSPEQLSRYTGITFRTRRKDHQCPSIRWVHLRHKHAFLCEVTRVLRA